MQQAIKPSFKQCKHCGHSRAAHADGMRCALCGCAPQRQTFVQTSLGFKTALPMRAAAATRKR